MDKGLVVGAECRPPHSEGRGEVWEMTYGGQALQGLKVCVEESSGKTTWAVSRGGHNSFPIVKRSP